MSGQMILECSWPSANTDCHLNDVTCCMEEGRENDLSDSEKFTPAVDGIVFERPFVDSPCTITLDHPNALITSLDLLCDAKRAEIYDHQMEYLATIGGLRVSEELGIDRPVFMLQYGLEKPASKCSVRLVSFTNRAQLWIHSIFVNVNATTPNPRHSVGSMGSIDLEKVRGMLGGMKQEVPESAQKLLGSIEMFQKNKQSAMGSMLGMMSPAEAGNAQMSTLLSMFTSMQMTPPSGTMPSYVAPPTGNMPSQGTPPTGPAQSFMNLNSGSMPSFMNLPPGTSPSHLVLPIGSVPSHVILPTNSMQSFGTAPAGTMPSHVAPPTQTTSGAIQSNVSKQGKISQGESFESAVSASVNQNNASESDARRKTEESTSTRPVLGAESLHLILGIEQRILKALRETEQRMTEKFMNRLHSVENGINIKLERILSKLHDDISPSDSGSETDMIQSTSELFDTSTLD